MLAVCPVHFGPCGIHCAPLTSTIGLADAADGDCNGVDATLQAESPELIDSVWEVYDHDLREFHSDESLRIRCGGWVDVWVDV